MTNLDNSNPRKLATLLGLKLEPRTSWRPDEMGSILAHQLDAPLEAELKTIAPGQRRMVGELTMTGPAPIGSMRALFRHPNPPMELLELVKRFSKAARSDPAGMMPPETATVFYFAAVVVAQLRCGKTITELEPRLIREGVQWCVNRDWIDPELKQLFAEYLQAG